MGDEEENAVPVDDGKLKVIFSVETESVEIVIVDDDDDDDSSSVQVVETKEVELDVVIGDVSVELELLYLGPLLEERGDDAVTVVALVIVTIVIKDELL